MKDVINNNPCLPYTVYLVSLVAAPFRTCMNHQDQARVKTWRMMVGSLMKLSEQLCSFSASSLSFGSENLDLRLVSFLISRGERSCIAVTHKKFSEPLGDNDVELQPRMEFTRHHGDSIMMWWAPWKRNLSFVRSCTTAAPSLIPSFLLSESHENWCFFCMDSPGESGGEYDCTVWEFRIVIYGMNGWKKTALRISTGGTTAELYLGLLVQFESTQVKSGESQLGSRTHSYHTAPCKGRWPRVAVVAYCKLARDRTGLKCFDDVLKAFLSSLVFLCEWEALWFQNQWRVCLMPVVIMSSGVANRFSACQFLVFTLLPPHLCLH